MENFKYVFTSFRNLMEPKDVKELNSMNVLLKELMFQYFNTL